MATVATAYLAVTPYGSSRAGDPLSRDLLAPPIGGPDAVSIPELKSSGMFYPKAVPAKPVPVAPRTAVPQTNTPPPTGVAKPRPAASAKSPSANSAPNIEANPDDLGVLLITCYTMKSNTASGSPPDTSTAATSPGFLPLGTVISIEGVGTFTVKDRGPLGKKVDIWIPTDEECRAFGKQYHRVKIVSRPQKPI
ncbi:MAG: hypothetical protein C4319_07900 [Acidimicrobiia bacterium]